MKLPPEGTVAWRNGNYIYCMKHTWSQVILSPEFLGRGELTWLKERKCSWCNTHAWKHK